MNESQGAGGSLLGADRETSADGAGAPREGARFSIEDRTLGSGARCFVIAEVAQAHDGSLGTAHAFIDAVARAGADAIKFQTHIAAEESTPGEPFRVKFSPQDATRYDYWKRMEFREAAWRGLATHARERGLCFLATPFSLAAAELLDRLEVPAWKIGSGDISHLPLLEFVARTRRPVLLSSGLSRWHDLDRAAELLRKAGAPFGVLQCTTAYPCPPERVGLNVMAELRARYGVPVGLSDHSGTVFAGLAAATLGANVLEVHVTLSREAFGPDVTSSVTTHELAELVRGVDFIHRALGNPVDKGHLTEDVEELRRMFGKSIVASRSLPEGHVLCAGDLAFKKPATGLPPERAREVIGKRLRCAIDADTNIEERHLV